MSSRRRSRCLKCKEPGSIVEPGSCMLVEAEGVEPSSQAVEILALHAYLVINAMRRPHKQGYPKVDRWLFPSVSTIRHTGVISI